METSSVTKIKRAIALAHDEADIMVIVGDAGTGKTTGAYQYQAESHSAFEVDPSFTKTIPSAEIARAVGVETKGAMTVVISRIVEALRERDAVLIVDEADHLSDAYLELLRRVIDDKTQTGVVLIGLPRLEYKLRNDHEQLTSQVGAFVKLESLKKQTWRKSSQTSGKTLPSKPLPKPPAGLSVPWSN